MKLNQFYQALTVRHREELRLLNAQPYTREVAVRRAVIVQELAGFQPRRDPSKLLKFIRNALGMRHHASV